MINTNKYIPVDVDLQELKIYQETDPDYLHFIETMKKEASNKINPIEEIFSKFEHIGLNKNLKLSSLFMESLYQQYLKLLDSQQKTQENKTKLKIIPDEESNYDELVQFAEDYQRRESIEQNQSPNNDSQLDSKQLNSPSKTDIFSHHEKRIINMFLHINKKKSSDQTLLEILQSLGKFSREGFEYLTSKDKQLNEDENIPFDKKKVLSMKILKIKKELAKYSIEKYQNLIIQSDNQVLSEAGKMFRYMNTSLINLQEYELKQQRQFHDIVEQFNKKNKNENNIDENLKSGRAWREHSFQLRE